MERPAPHPEFGEMQELSSGLHPEEGRRLADSLRALGVPATLGEHRVEGSSPYVAEVHGNSPTYELYVRVFVPAALHQVSLEVLDATTHRAEGDTPLEEILAALEEPEPPRTTAEPTVDGGTVIGWMAAIMATLIGVLYWVLR